MTSTTHTPTVPSAAPRPPRITALADGLRAETFAITGETEGEHASARTVSFTRAVAQGFYERWPSREQVERRHQAFLDAGQVATGVYVDRGHAALESWGAVRERLGHGADHPVGTFVEWGDTVNLGRSQLDALLISAVTVDPGFRRRGILSHMMTARLAAAVEDGVPLAALTVSEGGIYGRFGFGVATREQRIRINAGAAGDGFALRARQSGTVLTVDPTTIGDVLDEVFAVQHETSRGSVGRHIGYRKRNTARWSRDDLTAWDRAVRGIVHVREDGEVGGCATFRFSGWDSETPTMEVMDMVARDAHSRLELWRHLTEMDLVHRVTFDSAPIEDPLTHALVNPRARQVTGESDVLWVRVLDVAACLQSRAWGADGQMLLQVEDRLGIVDGRYRVSVRDGAAQVDRHVPGEGAEGPEDAGPLLRLDVETLGTLLLGDVALSTLHAAGRVDLQAAGAASDETAGEAALAQLAATWDLPGAPHCATHF